MGNKIRNALTVLFLVLLLCSCNNIKTLRVTSGNANVISYVTMYVNDTLVIENEKIVMDYTIGISNVNLELKEKINDIRICADRKAEVGNDEFLINTLCDTLTVDSKNGKHIELIIEKSNISLKQWNGTKILE